MASRSVFVLATVLSVQGKFSYPCCTRCRKRVRTLEQDQKLSCSSCQQCYEGDEVHYRFRISLVASDRSQVANVTVFGSCLDVFFGASATEFMRFLGRLQSNLDDHSIELTRLVHQAMQQCFVGSMLKFGFRLLPPCRTDSQILRSSPVNLDNVALKQQMRNQSHKAKPEGNQHNMSSVLANLVVPCVSSDCQTILGILQGYLERLHTTISSTPCSPDVTSVHAGDEHKDSGRKLSHDGRSSRNCGTSAIRCSGATGLSMLTSPLVLSCDSDISSSDCHSTPCTQGQCSDRHSTPCSDVQCSYRPSTPSTQGHCSDPAVEDQIEEHLEDFPSSEDLSAFLADLTLGSDFTGDEAGEVVVVNHHNTPALDYHNEWGSLSELSMTVDKLHNCSELGLRDLTDADERRPVAIISEDDASGCREIEIGNFRPSPAEAVSKHHSLDELTDFSLDVFSDDEGLVALINEEDMALACHDERESFNRPLDAVGKLHNFTDLTDVVLDGAFTVDEGLVAAFSEDVSSGCHTDMRSSNKHQNYTEQRDPVLADDLDDDDGQDVFSNQQATECQDEIRGSNEPIETIDKLHEFTELTDLPSSEDLEAFLADVDEDCFVEENYTCPAIPSPTKTNQASTFTWEFSKSLKTNAPEKTSLMKNKAGMNDLHGEVSKCIVVENGSENLSVCRTIPFKTALQCRPSHGRSEIFGTDDYATEGDNGVDSCQESTHNSCRTSSVSCDTPLSVAVDTDKICRANKRTQESKVTPNNLRVALLRKLTMSGGRVLSVSSPTLSPLRKIRREGQQFRDRVSETPEQRIDFGAYSEELFSGVEDSSASSGCDSCTQEDPSRRSTQFTEVFTCCEGPGVQEAGILDSSSVCTSSGGMRQCCPAQETDKSMTNEKRDSYICSVSAKGSFTSDSPAYFGSPELFSSSPDTHECSPNLFSPGNFDDCWSSCEASGSVLLFSGQASHSSCISSESVGRPERFSNIKKQSSICHSTPVLKAAYAYRPRAMPRSKVVTPQSWVLSGTDLLESPLMFSQLSNSSLVNSP